MVRRFRRFEVDGNAHARVGMNHRLAVLALGILYGSPARTGIVLTHPMIVSALHTARRGDFIPSVRADCCSQPALLSTGTALRRRRGGGAACCPPSDTLER